ncbi:MAG TPA: peptidoglycan-binding domain-containing protein, partial [Tepidisphaeraceae bacterium]|nr:peptidoglycan-binding domain-containing protein [Tepidisphaeraceae bacterium]
RTARQRNERNAQRTGNARASETAATANDTTTSGNNNGATQTTAATSTAGNEPGKHHGKGQKVDPQVVQQVKSQHVNFKAQPKPERVPAVTFNQNYRINGAQNWQGTHYEVFRNYHPQWHDQSWYRSHYPQVQIIAGGAYYFSNGFWFPAWGYNPSYQYYAYDAPIYVGRSAEPPDRVIADVQAVLQQEGYYKGEVDGLLGPLTREALTQYQSDNGLYATATIDEPTLSSLNLG